MSIASVHKCKVNLCSRSEIWKIRISSLWSSNDTRHWPRANSRSSSFKLHFVRRPSLLCFECATGSLGSHTEIQTALDPVKIIFIWPHIVACAPGLEKTRHVKCSRLAQTLAQQTWPSLTMLHYRAQPLARWLFNLHYIAINPLKHNACSPPPFV